MSQSIIINSINYDGEIANIIFTPDVDNVVINLGQQTLPFLFRPYLLSPPRDVYGTYTIVVTVNGIQCPNLLNVVRPTQTPTPTPTQTSTPTPTPTQTSTPTPTVTVNPCLLTPTPTPTNTSTVTPTLTSTPTPTVTLNPCLVTPTSTSTPTLTPTQTNTPTQTSTPTPTLEPLNLTLFVEYEPGSIIASYTLVLNRPYSEEIDVTFENVLNFYSGSPITIFTGVTVSMGSLSGQTIVTIDEDYSNYTGVPFFSQLSGTPVGSTWEIFVIPTPTPTGTLTTTPTPTSTSTPTPTPTSTPTPTPTSTPVNPPLNDLTYLIIPDNDLRYVTIPDSDLTYLLIPNNDLIYSIIPNNDINYLLIPNSDVTYSLIPNNDLTYEILSCTGKTFNLVLFPYQPPSEGNIIFPNFIAGEGATLDPNTFTEGGVYWNEIDRNGNNSYSYFENLQNPFILTFTQGIRYASYSGYSGSISYEFNMFFNNGNSGPEPQPQLTLITPSTGNFNLSEPVCISYINIDVPNPTPTPTETSTPTPTPTPTPTQTETPTPTPTPLTCDTFTFNSINANTTINSAIKTSGGGWDASAYSVETYTNPVTLTFQTSNNGNYLMGGFSYNPTGNTETYTNITYGLYIQPGFLEIYENGQQVTVPGSMTTLSTDIWKVIYNGTNVTYYKNDILIYTSSNPVTQPLHIFFPLLTQNEGVTNVCVIETPLPTVTPTPTNTETPTPTPTKTPNCVRQITVPTLWDGGTSINSNQLKLTQTSETLQIQVNDIITDNIGATSFVGIVSSDGTYTYVFTGPGGGVSFDCQFPLTFSGNC